MRKLLSKSPRRKELFDPGLRFDPILRFAWRDLRWCGKIGHAPPSSRGLGYRPFKAATGIRIPLGAPTAIIGVPKDIFDDRGAVV